MDTEISQNYMDSSLIIENMFNNSKDIMLLVNEKNKMILKANSIAVEIYGYSIEELMNMTIYDLRKNDSIDFVDMQMEEAMQGGVTFETFHFKKDCNPFPVEVNSINIGNNENKILLSIIKDVTLKKLTEKENKKNYDEVCNKFHELKLKTLEDKILLEKTLEYDKLKTDFLANVSHELRTPLNILLSAIQVLSIYTQNIELKDGERIKKYLKTMKQNCYRLLRLINNFLDITKIDAGYYKLNIQNHDIVNTVETITMSVVDYLKDKDIEILFDTEIEEKIMSFDDEKIERIILNLISNSIKYTEPGGKISVNIYDTKDKVTVSIKDTGYGIPKDMLDNIFNRFTQVEGSLIRRKEGTGIGLSLVKCLVEMHGGCIEAKSEVGVGSEFLFTIPVHTVEDYYQTNMEISKQLGGKIESNVEKLNIEFSDIYSV